MTSAPSAGQAHTVQVKREPGALAPAGVNWLHPGAGGNAGVRSAKGPGRSGRGGAFSFHHSLWALIWRWDGSLAMEQAGRSPRQPLYEGRGGTEAGGETPRDFTSFRATEAELPSCRHRLFLPDRGTSTSNTTAKAHR